MLAALYLLLAAEIWLLGCFAGRLNGDSMSYLALAESLLAGRGMVEPGPDGGFLPNLIRPPGYPAFLGFFRLLFGDTLDAPVLAQAVLICLSIETVRRRLAMSVGSRISLALPVLAMLCPGFLVHAGRISSEAPASFLLTVGLELFLRGRERSGRSLGVGVLLAAGGLFRQNLLIVIPLLCGIQCIRGGSERAGAWRLLAGAALILSPWAIHNYRLSGVISPMSALPEQYRFTYHADVLMLDAHVRAWWLSLQVRSDGTPEIAPSPVAQASESLDRAHRRAIERSNLSSSPVAAATLGGGGASGGLSVPAPEPVVILSTGVFPWGVRKAEEFLHALNGETRRLVQDLGVSRVLANRIGFAIPRTWFTGPSAYPPGSGQWLGVLAAALQLSIFAAMAISARRTLQAPSAGFWMVLLGLVFADILRYPVGTILTIPILGYLAARAETPAGVWAAVCLQVLVVLSARHAEFRYVTPHYPIVLALAIEAATHRGRDSAPIASPGGCTTAEQLKCPDG